MGRKANVEECAIERLNLSKTLERLSLVGTDGPLIAANDPLRTFVTGSYAFEMRDLWPIERAVLQAAAEDDPTVAATLKLQIETVRVTSFENSGSGFYSEFTTIGDVPSLPEVNPMRAGATGRVHGLEHPFGFILRVQDGKLSELEGYSEAGEDTSLLNFENVEFDVYPWKDGEKTR